MADIRAFRGIRYNTSRLGRDVSRLICDPYDIISPAEQAVLYERDPRNVVRLELPRSDPPGVDRYQRAADCYRGWLADRTLVVDPAPALYAYQQGFSVAGVSYLRRGLLAMMRLEPWERRVVRPHERTLPGPKADRLDLMRACGAAISPIWCLYRDPSGAAGPLWEDMSTREPDLEATDEDGVRHCAWVVTEPALLRRVHEGLANSPVYIADGHHRYETALCYQAEAGRDARARPEQAAWHFTMAYLVEMSDPGLAVLGTHRMIQPPPAGGAESIRRTLARWFDLEEHQGGAPEVLAALESTRDGPAFGIWAPALQLKAVARLRSYGAVPVEMAPGYSPAWRRLDLAALHSLVIDQLYPEGMAALYESGALRYSRSLVEVERAVDQGEALMGFLVRQTPVDQVVAVADAGDLMPEKSTYFHPKPATGIVIASLDGEVAAPA